MLDSLIDFSTDTAERSTIDLTDILESLTELQQELYHLRYGEQLSLRQIARRFGRSKGWAQFNIRKLHIEVRKRIESLHQETS